MVALRSRNMSGFIFLRPCTKALLVKPETQFLMSPRNFSSSTCMFCLNVLSMNKDSSLKPSLRFLVKSFGFVLYFSLCASQDINCWLSSTKCNGGFLAMAFFAKRQILHPTLQNNLLTYVDFLNLMTLGARMPRVNK